MKGIASMKLYKHSKEPEIYYYFNVKGEKLWMFRHKYYDTLGKRKEKKKSGFKSDKMALKALLEVKAATVSGQTKHIENDNLTVAQWLDMWFELNYKKWKKTSQLQRRNAIDNHIKPLIGNYKLQKINRIIYQQEFINVLEGKYKPSTIQIWHNIFKIAINAAVEEEILLRNKFTKVTLPLKEEKMKINYLTENDLSTLIDDARTNERITCFTVILTLAYTGMRRGEALGIQWNNIDFETNTITIERTRDFNGIRTPKTRNSYRTIPVDYLVMTQLKNYKKWSIEKLFSVGKRLKEDDLVFISKDNGEPICVNTPQYALERVIKRTNIHRITIHGLRHTHATILLNRKVNPKVIAERLGNTTDMIYKVYGHIFKELENEAVTVFSESLSSIGANGGAK